MFSIETRISVLWAYYNTNITLYELSCLFHVSLKTIYNWRHLHDSALFINMDFDHVKKQFEGYQIKQLIKYKGKLTQDIEKYIRQEIAKHPSININKFKERIEKKFNTNFSMSTLYNWFKKLGLTFKKVRKRLRLKFYTRKKRLKELHQQINNVQDKNNIISIDESHFQVNMAPKMGWSKSGQKIYRNTSNVKRSNLSLLMAINKQKVIGYQVIEGPYNAHTFTEFIKSINKDKYVLLLDNARIHHSRHFKEYMSTQQSTCIYNVPYNPETNPIEHVFSQLKQQLSYYQNTTSNKMRQNISRLIKKIPAVHLSNYFKESLNI